MKCELLLPLLLPLPLLALLFLRLLLFLMLLVLLWLLFLLLSRLGAAVAVAVDATAREHNSLVSSLWGIQLHEMTFYFPRQSFTTSVCTLLFVC